MLACNPVSLAARPVRAARVLPPKTVTFPRLEFPKLELLFRDGLSLWLKQVRPDFLKRQVVIDGEAIAIDLRDIAPGLEAELLTCATNDRAGVLFFSLRHQFSTRAAFVAAVLAVRDGVQEVEQHG